MKRATIFVTAASLAALVGGFALAQGTGTGPVAALCKEDIAKYCADASHGAGQVRGCLEEHRAQLSAACVKALDTTGRGRGRNQMK